MSTRDHADTVVQPNPAEPFVRFADYAAARLVFSDAAIGPLAFVDPGQFNFSESRRIVDVYEGRATDAADYRWAFRFEPGAVQGYVGLACAMSAPAHRIPAEALFDAVRAIGAFKLFYRNAVGIGPALPVLRRCNARIDELIREESDRAARRRPAA